MKAFFIFLIICPLLSFGGEILSPPACSPPSSSQWNTSLENLVKVTKNIVLVELASSSSVEAPPDIKSDFASQSGIAADGRRNASGGMKSLNDRGNTRWNFKIIQNIKGDLDKGKDFSFVSLKRISEKQPVLSPILCDYALNFKLGSKYLVFVNSYHPQGYQAVSGSTDNFFKKVLSLAKEK